MYYVAASLGIMYQIFFYITIFKSILKIFLHCADMSVNRNVWLWCELKSNFILKWLHTVLSSLKQLNLTKCLSVELKLRLTRACLKRD